MEKKYDPKDISSRIVGRLTQYLGILKELSKKRIEINSDELAQKMNTTAVQVRKDLSTFGEFGVRGRGYNIKHLIEIIENILGIDFENEIILVGYGKMGSMLTSNSDVLGKGFKIIGVFDKDKNKIGEKIENLDLIVKSEKEMEDFIRKTEVKAVILAVNSEYAQEITERLVNVGINGILNMTAAKLEVEAQVAIVNADISARLQEMNFWRNHPTLPKGGVGLG